MHQTSSKIDSIMNITSIIYLKFLLSQLSIFVHNLRDP